MNNEIDDEAAREGGFFYLIGHGGWATYYFCFFLL